MPCLRGLACSGSCPQSQWHPHLPPGHCPPLLCNLAINVQPNPIELVLLHYVSWSRYGGKVIQGILNGGTSLCLDSRQIFTRWHDQDQHRASLQRDRHGGGFARPSSTLTPATGSSSTSSPSLLTSGSPSPSAPRLRFVNSGFQVIFDLSSS